MILKGSDLLSGVTELPIVAVVAFMPDVGPVDSLSRLNLRTRPPHVRYVLSSDSSYYSGSYSEATSFVRSFVADAPVVMFVVTTTINADVNAGSKAKACLKILRILGILLFHDLTDRLAPPALFAQLRAMDYDQLYFEFNVGAARQVCLGAEERMQAEHTLERKGEPDDKRENALSERVTTLKSVTTSKEAELASLSSQVAKLTVDLSGSSFYATSSILQERIEALQDEQAKALDDRVVELDA
nr:hypothetical protein [Tanacetum cinerariifolium]GEZ64269.1 hypothetical protein [Tanacetum cinerariifolium]